MNDGFVFLILVVVVVVVVGFMPARRRLWLRSLSPEDRALAIERMKNTYRGIWINGDRIEASDGSGPLAGATARVETAGEITSRLSATRLALLGPVGLFARKRVDKRELYLIIEGNGFSIVRSLKADMAGRSAREFAARLNSQVSALASGQPPTPQP